MSDFQLVPNDRDPAVTNVYRDGRLLGTIRVRYTPQETFDAWQRGRLVYEGAETRERAAQALDDLA